MKRYGFTLIEVLLVVIILGILAAIIIPQYSAATEETKMSSLINEMQNVRSQIQLYQTQHKGALPTTGGLSFDDAMTKYTNADGSLANPQAPGQNVFGPYLQQIPKNPFISDDSAASKVNTGTDRPAADGSSGWFYNTNTGNFSANDDTIHAGL